jgi:hypothetical protein
MTRTVRLTEAELLHLVDQAEAGTLPAVEAVVMREGISQLAAAARSAGGSVAGMQTALDRARRDLRLAEDELATYRAPAVVQPRARGPMDVQCPRCHVAPYKRCVEAYGRPARKPHQDRVRAAAITDMEESPS